MAAGPRAGLSGRARRVLRAVAECLFWDGTADVPPQRLDWLDEDLNDYVRATAGTTWLALRLAAWVLQWSPLWALRRPRRLTGLSRERRLECLRRLERSRVALLPLLLGVAKVMLAMVYFEHPEALASTGFDGQCLVGEHPAPGLPPRQPSADAAGVAP